MHKGLLGTEVRVEIEMKTILKVEVETDMYKKVLNLMVILTANCHFKVTFHTELPFS